MNGTWTLRCSASTLSCRTWRVATANAAFLPFASSGFAVNQRVSPNRSLFDGGGLRGQNIITDQGNYDLGVNQRMKWGGGQYSVLWNSNRVESNNIFTSFNPSFGASMLLEYTQPLLRGFRTDPQRTQLLVQRINPRHFGHRSGGDRRQHARQRPAGVLGARLRAGRRRRATAGAGAGRAARARQPGARRDRHLGADRRRAGAVGRPPCDASSSRRPSQTLRTNELQLKQLIVGGTSDELWYAQINPTDEPQIDAPQINIEEAIRGALDRRTDISRVRQQIDINDAQVDNLRNSTLPALDLVGSYQLTGQGGAPPGAGRKLLRGDLGGAGGTIPRRLR